MISVDSTTSMLLPLFMDLFLAVFLYFLYRPVLHGPFVFDDLTILNNLSYMQRVDPLTSPSVRPLHRSPHLFLFSVDFYRTASFRNLPGAIASRPITNWLYEWNITTGGLNPYPFHRTSLGIGIACTLAFHHILLHFTHPLAAFMGALLLAAHPLATMSISYIAGRSSLLAGLFILLSILALLNYFLLLSLYFAMLAVLCKEEGVAAVPILVYMWIMRVGV